MAARPRVVRSGRAGAGDRPHRQPFRAGPLGRTGRAVRDARVLDPDGRLSDLVRDPVRAGQPDGPSWSSLAHRRPSRSSVAGWRRSPGCWPTPSPTPPLACLAAVLLLDDPDAHRRTGHRDRPGPRSRARTTPRPGVRAVTRAWDEFVAAVFDVVSPGHGAAVLLVGAAVVAARSGTGSRPGCRAGCPAGGCGGHAGAGRNGASGSKKADRGRRTGAGDHRGRAGAGAGAGRRSHPGRPAGRRGPVRRGDPAAAAGTIGDLVAAGVVAPQPGWTAAELAAIASAQRPAVAGRWAAPPTCSPRSGTATARPARPGRADARPDRPGPGRRLVDEDHWRWLRFAPSRSRSSLGLVTFTLIAHGCSSRTRPTRVLPLPHQRRRRRRPAARRPGWPARRPGGPCAPAAPDAIAAAGPAATGSTLFVTAPGLVYPDYLEQLAALIPPVRGWCWSRRTAGPLPGGRRGRRWPVPRWTAAAPRARLRQPIREPPGRPRCCAGSTGRPRDTSVPAATTTAWSSSDRGGAAVTLVGAADPFRNDRLDEHGNAALAAGPAGPQPAGDLAGPARAGAGRRDTGRPTAEARSTSRSTDDDAPATSATSRAGGRLRRPATTAAAGGGGRQADADRTRWPGRSRRRLGHRWRCWPWPRSRWRRPRPAGSAPRWPNRCRCGSGPPRPSAASAGCTGGPERADASLAHPAGAPPGPAARRALRAAPGQPASTRWPSRSPGDPGRPVARGTALLGGGVEDSDEELARAATAVQNLVRYVTGQQNWQQGPDEGNVT